MGVRARVGHRLRDRRADAESDEADRLGEGVRRARDADRVGNRAADAQRDRGGRSAAGAGMAGARDRENRCDREVRSRAEAGRAVPARAARWRLPLPLRHWPAASADRRDSAGHRIADARLHREHPRHPRGSRQLARQGARRDRLPDRHEGRLQSLQHGLRGVLR